MPAKSPGTKTGKSTDGKAAAGLKSLFARLNYLELLQILILLAIPSLYAFFVSQHFWTYPMPSDPTFYLEPAGVWHSFVDIFPCVDRVVVAIGLRLSDLVFSPTYVAGMYYIAIINTLIITVAVFWCYLKRGFLAGLLAGIFLVTTYTLLGYATYIYTDQTMALFALLAFIFFYSKYKSKWFNPMVLAGVFAALTCFSKIIGIAIFIPFAISIIAERRWGEIKKLVLGFIIGLVIIFIATYILFGWDSIAYLPSGAANYYSSANPFSDFRYNINLSYFGLILQAYYLPIFFSIVVLVGAYKEKLTRNLYFAAIGFIGILVLTIVFTGHAQAINNYLYPAVVFSAVGLAMYLAELLKREDTWLSNRLKFMRGNKAQLVYGVVCLACIFFALKVGIDNYSSFVNPAAENVSVVIRIACAAMPLVIVGGLLAIECLKSRLIILLFVLLACLWLPAYNGAFAYNKASADRARAGFFYEASPVLNVVPAKEFSVYVVDWNNTAYMNRLPRIYRAFFNEKYTKSSLAEAQAEISSSIYWIKAEQYIVNAKGDYILTDRPEEVYQYFPDAKAVIEVPWHDEVLTILELPQEDSQEG
jgi:hypothetical protein